MSGLLNSSINGSASNLQDSSGRSFPTSFSGQSGAASPVFHHSGGYFFSEISLSSVLLELLWHVSLGSIQGLHNMHGGFNVPNMPGMLSSRNSTMNNIPSGAVQQPTGGLSSERFASNNLPASLYQQSSTTCFSGDCL